MKTNNNNSSAAFALNEDDKDGVRDCLKKAEIQLQPGILNQLIYDLENTVGIYRKRLDKTTDREMHDALSAIWRLAHSPDPGTDQIRVRLGKLPKRALNYLDQRFRTLIHRDNLISRSERKVTRLFSNKSEHLDFISWANSANKEEFLRVVRALSSEGGGIVPGRSRGQGKRSKSIIAPLILGQHRGGKGKKPKGGAPRGGLERELVTLITNDWIRAASSSDGAFPKPRSAAWAGYRDLVYAVFKWLGLSTSQASYAMKSYWAAARKEQKKDCQT